MKREAIIAIALIGLLAWAIQGPVQAFPRGIMFAQKAGAAAPPAGKTALDAAAPPSPAKAPDPRPGETRPAADAKADPLKPFEPAEKVKADQAIDFPADI
jgi:hypothetical protein